MARPRRGGRRGREKVLWPCYFEARLSRAQGRRVGRETAVRSPKLAELVKALEGQGLEPKVEAEVSHPAFWHSSQGRVRVAHPGSKQALLKETAHRLKTARQQSP